MDEKLIVKQMTTIMQEMGAIGKNQSNPNLKYKFRGIDDIYNVLHSLMAKHQVLAMPEVLTIEREERKSSSGGVLITTLLTVRYTFTAVDGSSLPAVTVGEAMDSGDKGSNKAMSAAHKYALVQAFVIATDEKIDTEYETPEASESSKPVQSVRTEVAKDAPKKFAFRKPTATAKPSSFFDVLPALKIRYHDTFGKFDKYWLQLIENQKVSRVEDLTTSEKQADFLESVEAFMKNAERACGGRKFTDIPEGERADILATLDKLMLF